MLAFLHTAAALTVISGVPVVNRPSDVAVNSLTHLAYIPNQGANSVSVIDETKVGTPNNPVVATIGVGASPDAIALNEATNKIYVANHDSNNISVIDGSCLCVATTVSTGFCCVTAVSVNSLLNRYYAASGDFVGTVTEFDGATNGAICSNGSLHSVQAVVSNTSGSRLFVASEVAGGGTFAVLDGFTCGIVSPSQGACGSHHRLIYDGTNDVVYSTIFNGPRVCGYSMAGASRVLDLTLPAPDGAGYGIALDRNNQQLFSTAGQASAKAFQIDLASNAIVDSVLIDTNSELPNALAFDQARSILVASIYHENQVTFIASPPPPLTRDHKTDVNGDGYSAADEDTTANCGVASCATITTFGTAETKTCKDPGANCGSPGAPADESVPARLAVPPAGGYGCSVTLDITPPKTTKKLAQSDVDLDGSVTILDLSKVASWYGNTINPSPTDPRWEGDMDGDGQITILDLSAMASNFGRSVAGDCQVE
jgi:YVTN family beta-propeller protein